MENNYNRKESLEALGLNQNATQDQIKKKYRKLAKKFHPDLNKKNPEASKEFIKIKKAYDKLMINVPNNIQNKAKVFPKQRNFDNIVDCFLRIFRKDFNEVYLDSNETFFEPPEPFLDLKELIRRKRKSRLF